MTPNEEIKYQEGNRNAWRVILASCVKHLNDGSMDAQSLLQEREAVVSILRRVCELHGDNDWAPSLHLADVIEKHLLPYLEEKNSDERADLPKVQSSRASRPLKTRR